MATPSLLGELEHSRPIWWIYQGVLMVVDITVMSAFKMSPLSWVCYGGAIGFNAVDTSCIKFKQKRLNRWVSNLFNAVMAGLLGLHGALYHNDWYFALSGLHFAPIVEHLYNRLAYRSGRLPSIGGFLSNIYYNSSYTTVVPNPNEECFICLLPLSRGGQCVSVRCLHVFHRRCIAEWNNINANCPLCRINI